MTLKTKHQYIKYTQFVTFIDPVLIVSNSSLKEMANQLHQFVNWRAQDIIPTDGSLLEPKHLAVNKLIKLVLSATDLTQKLGLI